MFSFSQKVLFKHCDPAGIVFYPRYFEMINDVVEEYFSSSLNYPFTDLIPDNGVPTVQIEATFSAPSRMGDLLTLTLTVTALGRSSMAVTIVAHSGDELRFSANSVLVFVDINGKPTSWPESLRQTVENQMHGDDS